MLLKALYDFAHSRELPDDLAFAPKAIRWVIQLDHEGNVIGILDTSEDGRAGHKFPEAPKVSGSKNSGGVAEFLADRVTGVFGIEPEPEKLSADEKKRQARLKNNEAKHLNFWRQIQEAYTITQNQALSALLKFHDKVGKNPPFLRWGVKEGAKAGERSAWWIRTVKGEEFRYNAETFTFAVAGTVIFEEEPLRNWWRNLHEQTNTQKEEDAIKGVCLITGQEGVPIARTHDRKIEIGFPDTPPGGAAIVSFEKSSPSFSSFGYVQSYNAPTSINAAKAYCEALNHLIKNKNHHIRISNTNTLICFWSRDSKEVTDTLIWAFEQPKPESVREFLRAPQKGIATPLAQPDEFYSVTLSGNSGRIVVRHWMQIAVETALKRLRQWFDDLDIVAYGDGEKARHKAKGAADSADATKTEKEMTPPLALYRLACTTVGTDKTGKPKTEDLKANVPTQLYIAALEGATPPLSLLQPILRHFEIDLVKNGPNTALRNQSRFALLRLIVNRNRKEGEPMIEPKVFEIRDSAYNCGRLLAIFDSLQRSAHGKGFKGATIAERYFSSASTTPNGAFSMLWRLHQHHLKKLRQQGESGERAAAKIKSAIIEVVSLLKPTSQTIPELPRYFTPIQQGRFALGFYHQMADRKAAIEEYLKRKQSGQLKPEDIDEAIELGEAK